jgi:hypothetical protein
MNAPKNDPSIGVIHPQHRRGPRPGSRRWAAAQLLARPEGAGVDELLETFGLPVDSPMLALYTRLSALATLAQRAIRHEGRGRASRYFFAGEGVDTATNDAII